LNNRITTKQPSRQQIRQQIRQQRQQLSKTAQQLAAKQLLQILINHKKINAAQHIALYLSNDGELDTKPFIHWCWQQQKQVYLPVIHPFSRGHLLFLQYHPNSIMVVNQYGIAEPKLDIRNLGLLKQVDILLTPLVAFDNTGNRLGMGGGFYDRTLATWYQGNKNTTNNAFYPLGLAHNCQLVSSIPTQIWDIPLPEIITPNKTYRFDRNKG
jgi:5-formyltetrahydrofolate cyclo-ligase